MHRDNYPGPSSDQIHGLYIGYEWEKDSSLLCHYPRNFSKYSSPEKKLNKG